MNMTRKLASVVLAMILVLCVATSAVAAGNNSITVKNAVAEQEYKLYKMLDLVTNEEVTAYSYTVNSFWDAFFAVDGKGAQYVNIDAQGYVTWKEDSDVVAFAADAEEFAANVEAVATKVTTEAGDFTFEGLDAGYYLVTSTLGTKATVGTTPGTPNPEIQEKNEAPTVTKEVQEDSNSSWGETNDADINQVVNYKATITVQAGAENYILHDTMSTGLTYTGVTSVKIGETDVDNANYTVSTSCTDGCTFEVKFDNTYIASLAAGTQIVVEYSAALNENAVVAGAGNPNEVKLQYGDENKPTYTPEDTTITYTWDAKVVKFTKGENDSEILLAGATFKVSTDEAGNNVIKFHNLGNNEYEVCADSACTKDHVTEITTDSTGTFHIEGLDAGDYYLTEIAAPAGYNKLADSIKFTVVAGSDTVEYKTVEAKVENQSGTELPSTGGMGTTLFYIAGGVLVVAAFILLVTKRRVGTEK